jgi:23S rRNA (uracil1939-C5)-methyltransferase
MDDRQRVEIARMAHGGDGIGYLEDGRIVFVPTTLPGEVVDIEVVELKKSFGRGRVVDVVEASDERVESECPYFPQCGGCQFWHATYEHEVELKTQAAWETISRISRLDDLPQPRAIAAGVDRRYRTRVTFHRAPAEEGAGWDIGFYRSGSNELIDVEDCLITDPVVNEARRALEPALRDIGECDILIETADEDSVVVTLFPERNFRTKLPSSLKDFLGTLDQNPMVRGLRVVGDDEDVVFGDITVDGEQVLARSPVESAHLPSAQFRQSNRQMNLQLVDKVSEIIDGIGAMSVLELFCGSGNFSFSMPDGVDYFVGMEGNPDAVESARGLAELARLEGYDFRVADLSDGFVEALDEPLDDFDVVLLDPPRAGADEVCGELASFHHFEAIVYVSCDPACLGRDLKALTAGGWEVDSLTMFDMFPRTGHLETIAVLR